MYVNYTSQWTFELLNRCFDGCGVAFQSWTVPYQALGWIRFPLLCLLSWTFWFHLQHLPHTPSCRQARNDNGTMKTKAIQEFKWHFIYNQRLWWLMNKPILWVRCYPLLFTHCQFEASVHTPLSKDPASAACLLGPWRGADTPFWHVNVAGTEHNMNQILATCASIFQHAFCLLILILEVATHTAQPLMTPYQTLSVHWIWTPNGQSLGLSSASQQSLVFPSATILSQVFFACRKDPRVMVRNQESWPHGNGQSMTHRWFSTVKT